MAVKPPEMLPLVSWFGGLFAAKIIGFKTIYHFYIGVQKISKFF